MIPPKAAAPKRKASVDPDFEFPAAKREYSVSSDDISLPKSDERQSRMAAAKNKAPVAKPPNPQSAFAAQNLENLVMYDVDVERHTCGECARKISLKGHYS